MNALGRSSSIASVSASRPSDGTTIVHQWWAVNSRNESYEFSSQRMPAVEPAEEEELRSRRAWAAGTAATSPG